MLNIRLSVVSLHLSTFAKKIKPHVQKEITEANKLYQQGFVIESFSHLENAHVLGQSSTYWHVKVHGLMFLWALKQKSCKEMCGQFIRMVGATLFTAIKGVPEGNTGGCNVGMLNVMAIRPEHQKLINKAKEK